MQGKYNPIRLQFIVGQKVVVFNDNSEILFLKRSVETSRPGGWDFPGGGLELEDPVAGIKREAREEAAIEIDKVKPVVVISEAREVGEGRAVIIGYIARLKSGEVCLSFEHDEFRWLTIKEAKKVELPRSHRLFLQAAIKEFKKDASTPSNHKSEQHQAYPSEQNILS